MTEEYSSYIKTVETTVTKIRHNVRVRLNSRAIDIVGTLKLVPPDVTVSMVIGDDANEGFGDIIFIEEREGGGQ